MGVKHLSEGHCASKLRELNFSNCIRIGNLSVTVLAKKFALLTIFLSSYRSFYFVIKQNMNNTKRCRNVQYLSLCYCEQIEEDAIDLVGTIDNLLSVDLSGCKCCDSVSTLLYVLTLLWLIV